MYREKKVIAIITARGGSKGIKNKNIKLLAGKPLIAYTIENAKKSCYIDRIIVSTDSPEIKHVCLHYGAEVPFIRPSELANDDTPGIAPVLHALHLLEEEEDNSYDYVMQLQPTSPLRSEEDIDGAIQALDDSDSMSLISVTEVSQHPFWMQKIDGGLLKNYIAYDKEKYYRRQDFPELYILNGAIYLSKTKHLKENKTFYSKNTLPYIMPKTRSVDIDNIMDFKIAELIIKGELNDE